VPLALLVGYVEEPDLDEYQLSDDGVIRPEDVPVGDSTEDRRERQEIIKKFYYYWKKVHPELCMYNADLAENIYINHTSLVETAGRASLLYYSFDSNYMFFKKSSHK
jgi:hypothetical protein